MYAWGRIGGLEATHLLPRFELHDIAAYLIYPKKYKQKIEQKTPKLSLPIFVDTLAFIAFAAHRKTSIVNSVDEAPAIQYARLVNESTTQEGNCPGHKQVI